MERRSHFLHCFCAFIIIGNTNTIRDVFQDGKDVIEALLDIKERGEGHGISEERVDRVLDLVEGVVCSSTERLYALWRERGGRKGCGCSVEGGLQLEAALERGLHVAVEHAHGAGKAHGACRVVRVIEERT